MLAMLTAADLIAYILAISTSEDLMFGEMVQRLSAVDLLYMGKW